MITDSPDEPGVPFVYRTPEERAYNMQRLNLDKLVIWIKIHRLF